MRDSEINKSYGLYELITEVSILEHRHDKKTQVQFNISFFQDSDKLF